MKIALTGSAGYIGVNLRRALEADGHEVDPYDAFICRPYLDLVTSGGWPDAIVHCAAQSNIEASNRVHSLLRANVEDLSVLMTWLLGFEGPFVFFSSSAVYAGRAGGLYGASKQMGEAIVREALPTASIVRPFNVIGGTPPDTVANGHLLPRLFEHARQFRTFPLFGSGAQLRYYVHMSLIVEAVRAALQTPSATYDVRSDAAWSVTGVIQQFQAKHPLRVMPSTRRRDDPLTIEPDGTATPWTMSATAAFELACDDYEAAR